MFRTPSPSEAATAATGAAAPALTSDDVITDDERRAMRLSRELVTLADAQAAPLRALATTLRSEWAVGAVSAGHVQRTLVEALTGAPAALATEADLQIANALFYSA